MTVREASPADAERIAAISASGVTKAWDAPSVARFLDAPGCWALVDADDPPSAFLIARAAADEAEIVNLVVEKAERRRGKGRALVAAALERAASEGAAEVFLEVAEDNETAQALYSAAGFEPVGRRPDYYRERKSGHVDAVIMRRLITGTNHK